MRGTLLIILSLLLGGVVVWAVAERQSTSSPEEISLERDVREYERALAQGNGSPQVRDNLGKALVKLGRLKEAQEQYKAIVEMEPDRFYSHWALAVLSIDYLSEYARGLDEVRRAQQLLPPDYSALRPLLVLYEARAHDGLGDFENAISGYEQYLRLEGEDGYYPFLGDRARHRIGELMKAQRGDESVNRELFSTKNIVTWAKVTPFH